MTFSEAQTLLHSLKGFFDLRSIPIVSCLGFFLALGIKAERIKLTY